MCFARVSSILALLLVSSTSVAAQEPVVSFASALTAGTRVQVASTFVRGLVRGVVVGLDDNILTLAPESGLLKVPLQSITGIDVSLGQRRHTLLGLAAGVLSGVALGFAIPVDAEDCGPESSNLCSRAQGITGGTMLFGGIGTVIGALIKTDRWAAINIGLQPSATAGQKGLALAVAFRF